MFTGGQFDASLRLTLAKVTVFIIAGYRLVECRQGGVDQQVVMPGLRHLYAGRGDAHVFQSELDKYRTGYDGTIHRRDKIHGCLCRGRTPRSCRAICQAICQAGGQEQQQGNTEQRVIYHQ